MALMVLIKLNKATKQRKKQRKKQRIQKLDASILGSRFNLSRTRSQMGLSKSLGFGVFCFRTFYFSIAYLGCYLAIAQAHATDDISTFHYSNQPNSSDSLVINQSYQILQDIQEVQDLQKIDTNSNNTVNNTIKYTSHQNVAFQNPSSQLANIPSYEQTQPKVVTVDESYLPNNQNDSQNNSQNYQNNLQEDAFQSTHSPNITADMTDSATIDGTVDETIIDQPYSPLNAISPNTLKTFVKVIDLARNEYVKPINDEELFENAMKGMLKNIDPYAEFLDAQSYENLQAFTQGEIAQVGIVAEYSKQDDHWKITDIVQDSPANQSGIGKGFFLHQIDGFKLNKKTNQHDVNQLLSGMAGTMVDIVVSDAGRRKHKVTLQRTQPKKTAVTLIFDRNIAIIKIPVFQDNTRQQILDALVSLGKPIHGIVLDLQDNPGGLINSAIEVAGLFQKNIPVVQIENREGQRELMNAEGSSHLEDVPVVILQNRYSTSAAEVLASSIQSSKRGYVIGETSYGKGTVQAVIPIDNKQAVKLTVAYYLTADGKQINGVGVKPDIALMSDSIGQIDPDETSIDGLMNNSLTHKTTGKGINNNIKEGMNQDVYQTSNDISQKSIQNANIIPATQKSTNQRSKTPNNANIKDSISSQDIHKRWQQQAVDILLERNHYTNRALREKRLTQLARLNQQNRQLRKSLQSQNRNNITKNNKNNGQDNISNLGQIQYELEKNIAIPNGFLLVYPKTEP